jgi:hypothetical protein
MSIIVRLLINLSFNDIKPLIKAIYQPYRDSHDSYYELPGETSGVWECQETFILVGVACGHKYMTLNTRSAHPCRPLLQTYIMYKDMYTCRKTFKGRSHIVIQYVKPG